MVEAMEMQKGFKQTEVGVIPSDWEVKELDDLSDMKSGKIITSKSFSELDIYPCYGGNGLRGYTHRFTHNGNFALIGRQGALCGNVQYVVGKFFASEHAVVVTPNAKTDVKWLYYILTDMNLNQYSESSAQPGLSITKILKLTIPTPTTKTEQTAIATALNDADALITQLEKLIAKKRAIKQGAMQELLNGMRRLPNFSDDWITIALGDVGIFKTSSVDKVIVPGEKEVYLLNYMDVYKNSVINKTIITSKTSANNNELQNFNLKRGDIVFTPSSETPDDIGHSAVINEDLQNTLFSYHIVRYRFYDNEFMSHDFKRYVLNNKTVLDYFSQRATGSTRFVLTRKDFNETVVRIPTSYEEQFSIAKILVDMDTEIEKLEKKLGKYKMVKQGMMQNLLTGKIRLV